MTLYVFWLALVAALVALTGRAYPQLFGTPLTPKTTHGDISSTLTVTLTLTSTATSLSASEPLSTSGPLTTSQSLSTSVSSSTSGIIGTSSTQGQAHHFLSFDSKWRIVIGCVLGGFALTVLTPAMILVRRLRKKGTGSIEPVVASALNQHRPQDRHDDVIMSDAHLLWENRALGKSTISHNPIHSPNLATSSATLAPVRREYQPPHAHSTKSRDELRAARQLEINQRLQAVQREMVDLTLSLETETSSRPRSSLASEVGRQEMEESEMEVLHAQIHQLRAQIEQLQMERSSDWGQGLSDDPPPAYNSLL